MEAMVLFCLPSERTFALTSQNNPNKFWVIFFRKEINAFCYPALLTWMDAWFHIFSSKGIGKSEVTSILLTEARICLYNLYMNGNAPLLMGIYNTYSGYYKVRRRLYVNECFVKLTLSGKSIKKMGLTKYGHLFHAWSNA